MDIKRTIAAAVAGGALVTSAAACEGDSPLYHCTIALEAFQGYFPSAQIERADRIQGSSGASDHCILQTAADGKWLAIVNIKTHDVDYQPI